MPTELPSGVVAMGARSYVPKIGRFLQPDPVPGGTDNPYAYTDGNPVNETDVTGEFVEGAYLYAFNAEENVRSSEREAAREQPPAKKPNARPPKRPRSQRWTLK